MKADEIYGTKNPTPHRLLLDARFELPFGESFPPGFSEVRERPLATARAASVLFPLKCQRSEHLAIPAAAPTVRNIAPDLFGDGGPRPGPSPHVRL